MTDQTTCVTEVYLTGDPNPVGTSLTIYEVAALVNDMQEATFLRLPTEDHREVLIRPGAIAAIMPARDDEDDD